MTVLRIQVPSPPRKAAKLETKYRFFPKSSFQVMNATNNGVPTTHATPAQSFHQQRQVAVTTPSPVRFPLKRRTLEYRQQSETIPSNNKHGLDENHSENQFCYDSERPKALPPKETTQQALPPSDVVSIAGARSVSIPIKFRIERSPSPTSSMMDIDTTIEDGDAIEREPADQHSPPLRHQKPYGVQFVEHVCVTEIPNRNSYTLEQKQQMWNNSATIRNMAQRNMFEYNWEGRNWRQAMEEESFFEYYGSLIHPAHYQALVSHQTSNNKTVTVQTPAHVVSTV